MLYIKGLKSRQKVRNNMGNAEVKNIKGFSSAYPNMCDLKLLPNADGTWITIQDAVGTSMTIKLSDLSDYIYFKSDKDEIRKERRYRESRKAESEE